jgi:hypothetical protein
MIRFSSQKLIAKEQLYGSGKEADADAPESKIARRVFARFSHGGGLEASQISSSMRPHWRQSQQARA